MTTKPDLSPEAVERLIGLYCYPSVAATLRALLAAKEAAEQHANDGWEQQRYWSQRYTDKVAELEAELNRLRAERGAAWLAGRDAAAKAASKVCKDLNAAGLTLMHQGALGAWHEINATVPPADDAAAMEAVKANAWQEGYVVGQTDCAWKQTTPNPYRKPTP